MTLDEFDLALFVFENDAGPEIDHCVHRIAGKYPHLAHKLQEIADKKTTIGVARALRELIRQLREGPNELLQAECRAMIAE